MSGSAGRPKFAVGSRALTYSAGVPQTVVVVKSWVNHFGDRCDVLYNVEPVDGSTMEIHGLDVPEEFLEHIH